MFPAKVMEITTYGAHGVIVFSAAKEGYQVGPTLVSFRFHGYHCGQLIVCIAPTRRNHGGRWPAKRYKCHCWIQSVGFGIKEEEYRG